MSKNNAGLLEEGSVSPRLPTVEKLARLLGVSAGWLAYGLGDAAAAAETGPLRCHTLQKRFKEARGMLGIRELARRAETSPVQVRAAESGTMPSLDTLEDLARALGVSPAWLAFGTGDRELPPRHGAKTAPAAASAADR